MNETEYHPPHLSRAMLAQRIRLGSCLYRFVNVEDKALSDHDFILAVIARYQREREQPLIDPNE